jgi:hypothetical protein
MPMVLEKEHGRSDQHLEDGPPARREDGKSCGLYAMRAFNACGKDVIGRLRDVITTRAESRIFSDTRQP